MSASRLGMVFSAIVCILANAHAGFWNDQVVVNFSTDRSPGYEYGLRSLALSPDQNYVYGAWMHGDGIRWLYKYSTDPTTPTDTKTSRHYVARINYDDGNTQWRAVTASGNYVYAGIDKEHIGDATGYIGFAVMPSDLSSKTTISLSMPVNGIVASGNYLYMTQKDSASAPVLRYRLDNPATPVLDTTWGTGGTLDIAQTISGANNLRGLTTDSAGNLYICSTTSSTNDAGKLYKITVGATNVITSVTLTDPMDVAIFNNELYVTEYNGADSKIHKLGLDLSDHGYVTGTPQHIYSGGGYNSAGGYSGIDITSGGRVFLADQYWHDSGTGTIEDPYVLTDIMYGSHTLPEPGTLALFGLGIPVVLRVVRRKRKSASEESTPAHSD